MASARCPIRSLWEFRRWRRFRSVSVFSVGRPFGCECHSTYELASHMGAREIPGPSPGRCAKGRLVPRGLCRIGNPSTSLAALRESAHGTLQPSAVAGGTALLQKQTRSRGPAPTRGLGKRPTTRLFDNWASQARSSLPVDASPKPTCVMARSIGDGLRGLLLRLGLGHVRQHLAECCQGRPPRGIIVAGGSKLAPVGQDCRPPTLPKVLAGEG